MRTPELYSTKQIIEVLGISRPGLRDIYPLLHSLHVSPRRQRFPASYVHALHSVRQDMLSNGTVRATGQNILPARRLAASVQGTILVEQMEEAFNDATAERMDTFYHPRQDAVVIGLPKSCIPELLRVDARTVDAMIEHNGVETVTHKTNVFIGATALWDMVSWQKPAGYQPSADILKRDVTVIRTPVSESGAAGTRYDQLRLA